MRKLRIITIVLFACGLLAIQLRAEMFRLNDGRTLSGDVLPTSANDVGVQLRLDDGKYERVPWTSFSQDDLRKFSEHKSMAPLAEPFIEIPASTRLDRTAVEIRDVPRLKRPGPRSLFAAFLGSGPGLLIALILYAANIWAGYEISIFRGRPAGLVCGVSAIAPLVGPIVFLAMPTVLKPHEFEGHDTETLVETPTFSVPTSTDKSAEGETGAAGLRLARGESGHSPAEAAHTVQVFQRGAFTFNRRFFETKFPGFFGVVRRDAEKHLVIDIKSARGHFVAERITRITANDMHVQAHKGHGTDEVMLPFSEIQEVQLRPRDA